MTDTSIKELFIIMYKLLKDNKFSDVVISNTRCVKSIKDFNSINDMYDYTQSTYADSILIKKNGRTAFTERIYFHQFKGFKLNKKSITILTNVMTGTGNRAGYRQNIRF